MQRSLILSLAVVLFLAAGLGFLFGRSVAGLDETTLIERAARAHVAAGGRREDCVGRAGTGPVWIVVTCGTGADAVVTRFDRLGARIAPPEGPGT